jgi:hypothetical protein
MVSDAEGHGPQKPELASEYRFGDIISQTTRPVQPWERFMDMSSDMSSAMAWPLYLLFSNPPLLHLRKTLGALSLG